MSATYRGRTIRVTELQSGALGIEIDGRRIMSITAIFERQAIEMAREWIDAEVGQ
ncbi:MAG TPA: hypothetical protein VFO40_09080 [Chthoniobacterales bacterium]|nr:hypothetical protein [Chthoniobacterales bacterium]